MQNFMRMGENISAPVNVETVAVSIIARLPCKEKCINRVLKS